MIEGDFEAVALLLGRAPQGAFEVVVRDAKRSPVVILNSPLLDDGTPMPTLYWLVGRSEREMVARFESAGAVRAAEAAVDPAELEAAHAHYKALRDAALPPSHVGPVPRGGVGGTRRGVKCLHAHLAWYLAGGDDPVGRWVCTQLGVDPSTYLREVDFHRPSSHLGGSAPVAAVDCGTNTTRLLVLGAGGQPLERLMRTTRLGQGVDAERKLTRAAMDRSLEALASFREVIDSHGVARVRAVATSAVRDARNGEEFLQRAGDVLGVVPEVINGEQEGRLTQLGVDSTLDPTGGPFTVIDVGGGSTELVGAHGSELRVASLDIGCVRVTERFLEHDPPLGSEMEAARAHVREVVSQAAQAEPGFADAVRLIGVAGTVSALVRYGLGLSAYDRSRIHHARLALDTVEQAIDELSATSLARRKQLPALESERADVILGGGLVLAEAMAALGFDALVASESDLLDGVASQLLQD